LQSILNTNPDFVIWGEHNGFLRQVAEAYYQAEHPRFPDRENLAETDRVHRLRDPRGWPAWDNRCGEAGFRERFQTFVRSFFADPEGHASRWGFKEIRYPRDSQDRTFPFLFDCFPDARLIVLVREPRATIFSMLSHWVFSGPPGDIGRDMGRDMGNDELDGRILAAAEAWNAQYSLLYAFTQLHPAGCVEVRYEDLGSATTRRGLAGFLQTSSFDFDSVMATVKDAADKSSAAADRIRQRMLDLEPRIEGLTQAARGIHGYAGR
jgi:Sulfotransferase family